jgi:hypothetical protein
MTPNSENEFPPEAKISWLYENFFTPFSSLSLGDQFVRTDSDEEISYRRIMPTVTTRTHYRIILGY